MDFSSFSHDVMLCVYVNRDTVNHLCHPLLQGFFHEDLSFDYSRTQKWQITGEIGYFQPNLA